MSSRSDLVRNVKNSIRKNYELLLDARDIFLIFTLRTFSALCNNYLSRFFQISRNISNVIFRKLPRNYSNSGNISAHMTDINIEIIYRMFFPFFPSIRECRRFIVGEIEGKKKKKKFFPAQTKLDGRGSPLDWKLPNWFVDVAGANVRVF